MPSKQASKALATPCRSAAKKASRPAATKKKQAPVKPAAPKHVTLKANKQLINDIYVTVNA